MATAPSLAAPDRLLDPGRLGQPQTRVVREPFPFLIAADQLPDSARAELERDFPHYAGAGFFPYEDKDCGPSIQRLVGDLIDPGVASAIGAHLGIDNLGQYPTLVTLCRTLNPRAGTIHTDSKSKVATALLYLNETWPETSDGCLRFLANKSDIEAVVAPEIKPLYGNFVVFKRAENSFHGHLPYTGERRVIQVAWLTSEKEKQRKTQRGRMSRFLKWMLGRWDKRLGPTARNRDEM